MWHSIRKVEQRGYKYSVYISVASQRKEGRLRPLLALCVTNHSRQLTSARNVWPNDVYGSGLAAVPIFYYSAINDILYLLCNN